MRKEKESTRESRKFSISVGVIDSQYEDTEKDTENA